MRRSEYRRSERRACELVGTARSTYRYAPRPERQAAERALRERLRELAAERRRFGYRRLRIFLGREGWRVNHQRVYRLYRAEGLAVRRRKRKRIGAVEVKGATLTMLRVAQGPEGFEARCVVDV